MHKSLSICIKKTPNTSGNVVLFVAVLTAQGLRDHVSITLKAWKEKNIHVVLIIQADAISCAASNIDIVTEYADEIWLRPNVGYDFGAWGEHVTRMIAANEIPSERTFLTNDSVLGPINATSFNTVIEKILTSSFDVISLTDNHDNGHHLQSYFLALNRKAMLTPKLQSFFSEIENKNKIDEVILTYEIPFGSIAQDAGLTLSVVFPATLSSDPTIFEAANLLLRGYPFIKRKCLSSAKNLTNIYELNAAITKLECNSALSKYLKDHIGIAPENQYDHESLFDLYRSHRGKVSDKWSIYLSTYNRIFKDFKDKPLSMLEIGIQNGGSLEIWSKYFNKIICLIGCDIDIRCRELTYSSPNISVVVGNANDASVEHEILAISNTFNLIIDDGSHTSSDIIKSFCKYFKKLQPGGLYIIEDLHCSYFPSYEGGLEYDYSSIEFLKYFSDIVNFEHWGSKLSRTELVKRFTDKYGCDLDEFDASFIHSVEFVNSICIIRKLNPSDNLLGTRIIAGEVALVDSNPLRLK